MLMLGTLFFEHRVCAMWKRSVQQLQVSPVATGTNSQSTITGVPLPLRNSLTVLIPTTHHRRTYHTSVTTRRCHVHSVTRMFSPSINSNSPSAKQSHLRVPAAHHHHQFHSSATTHQDHYRILGVTSTATKEEIKKQYYKLAKLHHPDTTTNSNAKAATEQFTKIQNAYEVLGDEKLKREYDRDSNPSAAYSSNSYSSYSGFRPDSQEYSFHAWSTRSQSPPNSSRSSKSASSASSDWASSFASGASNSTAYQTWDDFVDEDDDDDVSEEQLFSDLFNRGYFRHSKSSHSASGSANSKRRKKPAAASSSSSSASSSRSSRASEDANADSFFQSRTRKSRQARQSTRPVKGNDVQMDVKLSFMEAAQGVLKNLDYTADGVCKPCHGTGVASHQSAECRDCNGRGVMNMRMPGVHMSMHVTCDTCEGSGYVEPQCRPCGGSGLVKEKRQVKVTIPGGVESSTSIRVVNQGHAGKRGGDYGHLVLKPIVAPHAIFTRSGSDLHLECTLPLTTALLGGTAQVPTLDGGMHTVRVHRGTQHLSQTTIPGRGIRKLNTDPSGFINSNSPAGESARKYGSQQITWRVELPKNLTAKAKDLLKQLALEMGNIHNVDLTADIKQFRGKGSELDLEVDPTDDSAQASTSTTTTPSASDIPSTPSNSSTSTPTNPGSSSTDSSTYTTVPASNDERVFVSSTASSTSAPSTPSHSSTGSSVNTNGAHHDHEYESTSDAKPIGRQMRKKAAAREKQMRNLMHM